MLNHVKGEFSVAKLSNSDKEKIHLLSLFIDARANKNKYTTEERNAKTAFLAFVKGESGSLPLLLGSKTVIYDYGELVAESSLINPRALYEYAISLDMADEYWECINVVKDRASKIFSPKQLSNHTTIKTTTEFTVKERK